MLRRDLLKLGFVGLGAAAVGPQRLLGRVAGTENEGVCLLMGNHASYIGMGWTLGIEGCALSVIDCLNVADQSPRPKLCINLDARAYELLAQEYPLLCERLKKCLADGKVELIAGTYSQPLGTLFSGESNIRQIVTGHEVIRQTLGVEVESFLEEEEFSHPQLPQILSSAGVKYTSLYQHDSIAYAGCPELPLNVFPWKGMDGSTILCMAKNSLHVFDWSGWMDRKAAQDLEGRIGIRDLFYFVTPQGRTEIEKFSQLGKPCIQVWDEMGAENPEEPHYLTLPQRLQEFSKELDVEYVTLSGYLKKYGSQARESIYLSMDAWKKLLPWGIGGDQIRVNARKVEATLHAAERFEALASASGMRFNAATLDAAWRNLLTAQSHDVNLCEYVRQFGETPAPSGLREDHHRQTWGSIGYQHLDEALKAGKSALEASLTHIAHRIAAPRGVSGTRFVIFNPCSWQRTGVARTGRISLTESARRHVSITNNAGITVPCQIEEIDYDSDGNVAAADISFLAEGVPALGYDTYCMQAGPAPVEPPRTALRLDEANFAVENELVHIRLDPAHGGLISLIDKNSGKEFISAGRFSTPAFHGQPNLKYPFLVDEPDTAYDSATASATLQWVEKGPLCATLRAVHKWKQMTFETRVTLFAHSPQVEVVSRVLMTVPPALDGFPNLHAERDINHGYWLAFAPAFAADEVRRDFPLGVEATKSNRLHGLSFVDLVGQDRGLLIVHSGSQYFRRESDGAWSNLLVREWDSFFNKEYGFPNYAEFRHSLYPHGPEMDDAHRNRAAMEFDSPFLTVVPTLPTGTEPPKRSFLEVEPDNVVVSAFRGHPSGGYELRLLETAGRAVTARVRAGFAWSHAVETDLRGRPIGDPIVRELQLSLRPWQFRTLRIA